MVKTRLDKHLEDNKIISKFQSGFRPNRSTVDNIFYFTEKAKQAHNNNPRNKAYAVVFDIAKAFDRVWLNGLLYKLHKINLPEKTGKWIQQLIFNRKFYVQVNKERSEQLNIETGVGQGSILSPTLFSIFINDIVEMNISTEHTNIDSLLFADDLFAMIIDFITERAIDELQRYLYSLEKWLVKWRMKVAPHKCSYSSYLGKVPINIADRSLSLIMFNERIPIDNNPRYLGVTLDHKLKFKEHTKNIHQKCTRLLNILRNLTNKKWALDTNQQLTVYKALIRSCMEYAAPLLQSNKDNIKKLNGIQYRALKIIFKAPLGASSTELHTKGNIEKVKERLAKLSNNYARKTLKTGNELLSDLIQNHEHNPNRKQGKRTPLDIIYDQTTHRTDNTNRA
jgi:hypothetical protein